MEPLEERGFVFLHGEAAGEWLGAGADADDWSAYAESWNDLELDTYMADRGRYRRRRHARFEGRPDGTWERGPDGPHHQDLEYNRLNGGIERWYAAIEPGVVATRPFSSQLEQGLALFSALEPSAERWGIEAHQFRIEARVGEAGLPTPEGIHRDGVDYVLVSLVGRANVRSGTTTVHDEAGTTLGSFTLTDSLDTALLDDRRVWHGVTPVEPIDETAEAWRDVLVLTFRATPGRFEDSLDTVLAKRRDVLRRLAE
ncbi:MAG: 2OG-Fe dioxygenase family protein [Planctomycetota bacterium]